MDMLEQQFSEWLKARGAAIDDRQLAQFADYFRELVSWNEKVNLTAITDREAVYVKHFYDSASLAFCVTMDKIAKVADIGSGAGFPGIPLKILYPGIKLTIVDSLHKRIVFLRHIVDMLGLDGVDCVHARAEDAARNLSLRDSFDLVTARAVAKMNVLTELCLPFVKPGGLFVAMKGSAPGEEIAEAEFALRQLGGKLKAEQTFKLPVEQAIRHIVVIEKLALTPHKYPRKPGLPNKQPLSKSSY